VGAISQGRKLLGHNDPLFPASRVGVGRDQHFEAQGLASLGWRDGAPISKSFGTHFDAQGSAIATRTAFGEPWSLLGERLCRTAEEFKSWSQNLGHEEVLTTFRSYGEVSDRRQADIMRGLADGASGNCFATVQV
jgi:hypothetical protein